MWPRCASEGDAGSLRRSKTMRVEKFNDELIAALRTLGFEVADEAQVTIILEVLARLSNAKWLQLKRAEDRRRFEQKAIQVLSRELRDRNGHLQPVHRHRRGSHG